ncbi:hypothetical protein M0R72_06220 [Candidatus Pacearchaeota archaeon]|jgi:hypothetical protein|nr:hypothetical protein [Candidatus Pacearchaeota archaeon]
MLNLSYLARSVARWLGEVDALSGYIVLTRPFDAKQIVNANAVHVSAQGAEAFAAPGRLGSSNWAYIVVIDLYIPQHELQDYDDGPVGLAVTALAEALAGSAIRYYEYNPDEWRMGTAMRASAVKIDLGAGPAARFEIVLAIST